MRLTPFAIALVLSLAPVIAQADSVGAATAEQAHAANNRGGNDLVLEAEQRRVVTGNSRIDDLHGLWDDERSPTSASKRSGANALTSYVTARTISTR